jgi:hypothetical protein
VKSSWDSVISAVLLGRQRRAHYERTATDGVTIFGTVAVIRRGERFVVGWHEVRDDRQWADDWEWTAEGESEFHDIDDVNAFLVSSFELELGDLESAKGVKFFPTDAT